MKKLRFGKIEERLAFLKALALLNSNAIKFESKDFHKLLVTAKLSFHIAFEFKIYILVDLLRHDRVVKEKAVGVVESFRLHTSKSVIGMLCNRKLNHFHENSTKRSFRDFAWIDTALNDVVTMLIFEVLRR